jgi:hypothetical protein
MLKAELIEIYREKLNTFFPHLTILFNEEYHSFLRGRDSIGRPIFKIDFVGSLSHKNEVTFCCIAKKEFVKSIGVDIEILKDKDYSRLSNRYRKTIHTDSALANNINGLVLFSVLEAAFKCLSSIESKIKTISEVAIKDFFFDEPGNIVTVSGCFVIDSNFAFRGLAVILDDKIFSLCYILA